MVFVESKSWVSEPPESVNEFGTNDSERTTASTKLKPADGATCEPRDHKRLPQHSCPKRELRVTRQVTFSPTIPSSCSQRTSLEHHLQPDAPSVLVFCSRSRYDWPVSDDLLSKPGPTRSYLGTTTLSALAFYALGGQCFCLPCC